MSDSKYFEKVLIVDDMPTIREVLRKYLEEIGFSQIHMTESAKDTMETLGLEAGLGEPYEIIFLDINLPDKDGIQILTMLRENEVYRDTPVIMVSTENEQATVVKALREGATNYILKPFDREVLKRKVEEVLSSKK